MRPFFVTIAVAALSCTGTLEGPRGEPPAIGPPTATASVDRPSNPVDPLAPVDPTPPPGPPVYLPAGIRRLSQAEVQNAAAALLGIPATDLATAMGSDIRQGGFTRNADQRVGSVQAEAIWQAAQGLAHQAITQRLATLAPCPAAGGSETCAQNFIHTFASKAFRRSSTASEEAALLTVYRAAGMWSSGLELVIATVLQSASFLYVTELGAVAAGETTTLSGEEIATTLALLFTGAPADDALLAAGHEGALSSAAGRESAARALLAKPAARAQVERLLLEWQGSDAVDQVAKDSGLFPEWAGVRGDVLAESRAIVDAVMFEGDGTLKSLLSTPQTTVTSALAIFYELTGSGPMLQPNYRRGLLLAGGFSASNAHFNATAPVKRGAVVRKKLLCQDLPLPSAVGLTIVVPPPDPTLTTRERFSAHSSNAACAGCHQLLDPIGFALESFDATGRYRATENGKVIDTAGALIGAGDADGAFTDAVGMSTLLANSRTVAECFDRQLFRFASGRSGVEEERTFVEFVRPRPSGAGGRVLELLVDYAQSDSFVTRRIQ